VKKREAEERLCASAAAGGSLACLKFLHENGCVWSYSTCRKAAKKGHLECLMYAHENGCVWDHGTCRVCFFLSFSIFFTDIVKGAAFGGNLECLKYTHVNGGDWDTVFLCAIAAYGGNVECLKYAREHGCGWNSTLPNDMTTFYADNLKYLYRKGSTWEIIMDTCMSAAITGHLECLK
jgi:hypothetical protein